MVKRRYRHGYIALFTVVCGALPCAQRAASVSARSASRQDCAKSFAFGSHFSQNAARDVVHVRRSSWTYLVYVSSLDDKATLKVFRILGPQNLSLLLTGETL